MALEKQQAQEEQLAEDGMRRRRKTCAYEYCEYHT